MTCSAWLLDADNWCQLAEGHGGPHFSDRVWWQECETPPDWTPPRFTVSVTVTYQDDEVYSTLIANPDGDTIWPLPDVPVRNMRFRVQRIG